MRRKHHINPRARQPRASVWGLEGEQGGHRAGPAVQVPSSSGHKALASEAQVDGPGWLADVPFIWGVGEAPIA